MISRPISAREDTLFWEGAADHRLVVQRCAACNKLRHPPTSMCAVCGCVEVEPHACSGRGRILSWIFSRHPNAPDEPSRIVVLVQLVEGLRIVSNLVDPPDAGPYDDRDVEVDFIEVDDATLPVFRIVGSEAGR